MHFLDHFVEDLDDSSKIFEQLTHIRRSLYGRASCRVNATHQYESLIQHLYYSLPISLTVSKHAEIGERWQVYRTLLSGQEHRYMEDMLGTIYFSSGRLPGIEYFVEVDDLGSYDLAVVEEYLYQDDPSTLKNKSVYINDSNLKPLVIIVSANEAHDPNSDQSRSLGRQWQYGYSLLHEDIHLIQETMLECLHECHDSHTEEIAGSVYIPVVLFISLLVTVFIVQNAITTSTSIHNIVDVFYSRTGELKRERRKTQLILRQMLPKSIAKQLERGEAIHAREYDMATVFFSDMVDFSEVSQQSEPLQIVTLLNSIYNLLDSRIDCYDVYKVETIGAVYMVVSGIPVKNDRQVSEIANMALDIRERTNEIQISHLENRPVRLRIGINTGRIWS